MGFKSQADIDAAYQSGYNTGYSAGEAAGVTNHTGTYTITNPPSTSQSIDLGIHHSYRYIDIVYTVVSWHTGDINTIKNMLDDPNINVADYWYIGEQRTETSSSVLGSTSQTWVLTDFNGSTSGGTSYNAIIHTLALYPTGAKMFDSNDNSGGWNSSVMRTNTMPSIYNSLNSNFKPLIKTVINVSGIGANDPTTNRTSDQIWLFSEREVYGARTYAGTGEHNACKQFNYFTTLSNRVKGGNQSGNSAYWFLRTVSSTTTIYSVTIYFGGTVYGLSASANAGVCAAAAI